MGSQPGRQGSKAHLSAVVHLAVLLDNVTELSILPTGLAEAIRRQLSVKSRKFVLSYGGSVFDVEVHESDSIRVAVVNAADQPLPKVFGEGFGQVNLAKRGVVTLYADTIYYATAQTGWYVGERLGFPLASCMVDPRGQMNNQDPTIYCQGSIPYHSQFTSAQLYANVVGLFRAAISGELTPTSTR